MNRPALVLALAFGAVGGSLVTTTVAAAAPTPATKSLRQRAAVKWKNGNWQTKGKVVFAVPGVGSGELVCRPDAAYIRLYPNDRTRETSLFSVVGQVKGYDLSYAVKNARIYTFSTPTTPQGASGSGDSAQEGFNVENGVEDSGTGLAIGLISQRTAFNQPAAPTAPLTSVLLDWEWSGFHGPKSGQRCKATARFVTKQPAGTSITPSAVGGLFKRVGPKVSDLLLDWHGEADAALGKTDVGPYDIPGLGTISATCPTGRDSAAALIFKADRPAAGLRIGVARWQGESTDLPDTYDILTDPSTGIARVALPTNGFLYLVINGEGSRYAKVPVSTWRQTNDEKPAENFCEIAAQVAIGNGAGSGDDAPTA